MRTLKSSTKNANKRLRKRTHKHSGSVNYRDIITKTIRRSIKSPVISNHKADALTIDASDFKSSDPNIFLHYAGNDKMIPKFKVINSPSFAAVSIYLKEGQCVYSNF